MTSVNRLEIKCRYEPNGCTTISFYNDFEIHETNCEYQLEHCQGGNENIIRKEFDQHCQSCQHIAITCQDCSTSYQQKDKSFHTETVCLRIQVQQLKALVQNQQKQIKENNFWPDFIKTIEELNQLRTV